MTYERMPKRAVKVAHEADCAEAIPDVGLPRPSAAVSNHRPMPEWRFWLACSPTGLSGPCGNKPNSLEVSLRPGLSNAINGEDKSVMSGFKAVSVSRYQNSTILPAFLRSSAVLCAQW
jgi:hypothetical protein